MDRSGVLRGAARAAYERVRSMAGTDAAAGDNGVGAGGDVSRNIDIAAEEAVLGHIRDAGMGCTVLGEECGRVELGGDGYVVMDAVDGSANAVRGVPFYCCSLAFATGGRLGSVTDSVVLDLYSGREYWASEKGCFAGGARAAVRSGDPVYRIVGVNTSGAGARLLAELGPLFESHTRHLGANALEMALLADGRMDAMVDMRGKIRVQDLAAGMHLVRAAGGVVLGMDGADLDSDLGYETRLSFVAASSAETAGQVMRGVPGWGGT